MTSLSTGAPFADIRQIIAKFPSVDRQAITAVKKRDRHLTKPPGSLGRLEDLVEWMAGWQRREKPVLDQPLVAIFAANHGLADKGVSAFPQSVTAQMVANFSAGGAAINQLCESFQLGLKVFELALEMPTPDISETDAFSESECAATIAYGMEAVAGGIDLLAIGEMGIGNTSVAAGIYCALYGGDVKGWIGPGTGLDEAGQNHKADIVQEVVNRVADVSDPLEILRKIGGREIAAMTGAIIAARMQNVPVVVDGYVATSAAALVAGLCQGDIGHCLFAHVSAEPAHRRALEHLGVEPLLDLGMRLGEGSGAALAAGLVRAAVNTHNHMATFDQAGVSDKKDAQ